VRRRLFFVALATTTLVVVAFAVPLGALIRAVARDRAVSAAERDASALAPVLAITSDAELIAAAIARTTLGAEGRLAVVLPDGTTLGDRTDTSQSALLVAREGQRSFHLTEDDGLSVYSPVLTGAGDVSVIRARVPASLMTEGVTRAWAALGVVAVALVGAAAFVADRLARSVTREAGAMARTARAIAGGDHDARVGDVGDTPELVDAARALDLLADRIDTLRAAERERVADLSHRLRTPLTALRLDADRAGDAQVAAGVDRVEAAVTELIRNARRPLAAEPPGSVDVAAVVDERVVYWSALADDDGREWSADIAREPLPVAVDRDELIAALDALIGNVFSHTPDGTAYRVEARRRDDVVVVAVEDAGPGMGDAATLAQRGTTGGSSTGLGLDICRQTAEAAGGHVVVSRGDLGGTRVEMLMPFASS
jgi:signal transduction histidine kinase